ncbi:YbdD/YjiX family protein [Cryobacterium sp. CG_9.6]|uniref:YbdD/YjiX family protein n=1 Tax=Cryobacterium sp. CG_9.6 TaxID=2760710 RepID=UPI0024746869|nr:YbdD/YjiX family protein [Cryobacterium sp. CG_9.6]
MSVLDRVRKGASSTAWYLRALLGEDAYDKYAAHHASRHASADEAPPMTEREFWRDQTDRQDKNPQGRCC